MKKINSKETEELRFKRWEDMYKKEIDDLIEQNATAQERFLGKGNANYTESVITITDEIRSILIVHDGQFSEYLEDFLYLKNFLELIGVIVYDCFKTVLEVKKKNRENVGDIASKIITFKRGKAYDWKKMAFSIFKDYSEKEKQEIREIMCVYENNRIAHELVRLDCDAYLTYEDMKEEMFKIFSVFSKTYYELNRIEGKYAFIARTKMVIHMKEARNLLWNSLPRSKTGKVTTIEDKVKEEIQTINEIIEPYTLEYFCNQCKSLHLNMVAMVLYLEIEIGTGEDRKLETNSAVRKYLKGIKNAVSKLEVLYAYHGIMCIYLYGREMKIYADTIKEYRRLADEILPSHCETEEIMSKLLDCLASYVEKKEIRELLQQREKEIGCLNQYNYPICVKHMMRKINLYRIQFVRAQGLRLARVALVQRMYYFQTVKLFLEKNRLFEFAYGSLEEQCFRWKIFQQSGLEQELQEMIRNRFEKNNFTDENYIPE